MVWVPVFCVEITKGKKFSDTTLYMERRVTDELRSPSYLAQRLVLGVMGADGGS